MATDFGYDDSEERKGRVIPGSVHVARRRDVHHPTTDESYTRRQAERTTSAEIQERNKVEKQRKKNAKIIRKGIRGGAITGAVASNREIMRALSKSRGGIRGTATLLRKQKVILASIIGAGIYIPFYFWQVVFWVVSMAGLGIESGLSAAETLDLNMVESMTLWFADALLPGQTLFAVGWIVSSAIGVLGLLIMFLVFTMNLVNPFRGGGLIALGIVFTFTMMPIVSIVPWAVVWAITVYRNQSKSAH